MNYLDIPSFVWDYLGVGEVVLLKWECEAQKAGQGWSRLVKPSQTQSNPVKPSQTQSNPVKPSQTQSNPVKPSQTQSNPVKLLSSA
jgi:hypothetical protein